MVINTDAVIDPGTMMVEAFYAAVADCAVLGTRCAENFALGTHLAGVDFR